MKSKTLAEKTAEECVQKIARNILDQITCMKDIVDIIQASNDEAVKAERDRIKKEVHELFAGNSHD